MQRLRCVLRATGAAGKITASLKGVPNASEAPSSGGAVHRGRGRWRSCRNRWRRHDQPGAGYPKGNIYGAQAGCELSCGWFEDAAAETTCKRCCRALRGRGGTSSVRGLWRGDFRSRDRCRQCCGHGQRAALAPAPRGRWRHPPWSRAAPGRDHRSIACKACVAGRYQGDATTATAVVLPVRGRPALPGRGRQGGVLPVRAGRVPGPDRPGRVRRVPGGALPGREAQRPAVPLIAKPCRGTSRSRPAA